MAECNGETRGENIMRGIREEGDSSRSGGIREGSEKEGRREWREDNQWYSATFPSSGTRVPRARIYICEFSAMERERETERKKERRK